MIKAYATSYLPAFKIFSIYFSCSNAVIEKIGSWVHLEVKFFPNKHDSGRKVKRNWQYSQENTRNNGSWNLSLVRMEVKEDEENYEICKNGFEVSSLRI